jgi:cell division protein ZapB
MRRRGSALRPARPPPLHQPRRVLTREDPDHYSVPMEAELDTLDAKITQLIQLCQRLREDNSDLRQQLVATQNQNKQLTDKIEGARNRLEALLSRIPDDG